MKGPTCQGFLGLVFSKVPVSRLRAQQYRIDWRRNPKQFFAKFAIFWIVLPCIAIQCITNNVVQCNIQSLAPLLYDIVQHWAIFLNIVHLHCTVHNGVLSIRRDKKTMMRRPTSLIWALLTAALWGAPPMFAKYSRELLFCIYQLLLQNPLPRIFCKLQGGGGISLHCCASHIIRRVDTVTRHGAWLVCSVWIIINRDQKKVAKSEYIQCCLSGLLLRGNFYQSCCIKSFLLVLNWSWYGTALHCFQR